MNQVKTCNSHVLSIHVNILKYLICSVIALILYSFQQFHKLEKIQQAFINISKANHHHL